MSISVRRVVKNFGAFAAMRLGTAVVSFLFFVYLARRWSQEGLGEFTTVLAIFFLLYQLPLLGLHIPVIRELAQNPERSPSVIGNLTIISLVVAVILGLLLGMFGLLSYPAVMQGALWLVAISLLPGAIAGVAEAELMAGERMSYIALVNAIELVVRTGAWCILVWMGAGLVELAAALLAGRVLTAALYLRGGLAGKLWRASYDIRGVRLLMSAAPVYMGLVVLTAAISRMDFVLLSKLADLEQVGLYSAPYKLYEAGMMVPTILIVVVFPGVARLSARSASALDEAARQLCRVWLTLGLPVAVAGVVLAAPVLQFFFGESFLPAAPALAWLAVVPVIASVDITMSCVLQACHQQTHDLRALAIAFGAYLLALLILIPIFGFVGAAVATALGALIQAALRYHAARTRAKLSPLGSVMLPPLVAAGAMAATALGVGIVSQPLALVAGVAVYVGVLALTRGVTHADMRLLRDAWQQRAAV